MIIGILTYSYALSSLTSFIQSVDSKNAKLKDKLEILDDLRNNYPVNYSTYNKIKKAIKYGHSICKIDKFEFLKELPQSLRIQLSVIMHQGMINRIPFFQDKDPHFISTVCPMLRPIKVQKNEYICKERDPIEESKIY